jgi:hypothetical protein
MTERTRALLPLVQLRLTGRFNSITSSHRGADCLLVNLTRQQIENSPAIESHKPVSLQYQAYWDGGETLTNICRDPDMPAWTTVYDWKKADESFRQAFMRAREQQAEVWADELVDISDAELPTREAIRRARLRMQSRQWLAGKFNPQFADKPTTQVGVNVGVGVVLPEAERQKLIERRDRALLANQGDKSGGPLPEEKR